MASASHNSRLDEILAAYLRRVDQGERPNPVEVVAANPDLAEELRAFFSQAQAIEGIGFAETDGAAHELTPRCALQIRCPHCRAPAELAADAKLTDLTCSACGSHFSLVNQNKKTWTASTLTNLGRFELIERLGVGGFGSVWKARDRELKRTVAVKIPRYGALTTEDQEKFFREARAAAQLRHPNIVSVHEVGRDAESVYIVSDFVRGVTLTDWLIGRQPTGRETAELCAKLADALHHAHENGVVHRDLKPANVMIDGEGQPHLMDFGLARREFGEQSLTIEGQVLGTAAYMSPEQAMGASHQADRRSDVYSLGVILFQVLTGELPFRGSREMLMYQTIYDEPPCPRKFKASVPRDLETITLKCLEKDRSRRYQSAHEVAEELRRYLRGEPIHARPISRAEGAWRWAKRNPAVAALASLLLVVGITSFLIVAVQLILRIEAQKRWVKAQVDALLVASDESIPFFLASLHEFEDYAIEQLEALNRDADLTRSQRIRVALALLPADPMHADELAAQLPDATPGEIRVICDAIKSQGIDSGPFIEVAQRHQLTKPHHDAERDTQARQQANSAIARARLQDSAPIWPLLRSSEDNSLRSYIIDRWAKCGGSSEQLINRLSEPSIANDEARALLLVLGSYPSDTFSESERANIVRRLGLFDRLQSTTDPGLHAVCRWLLIEWGFSLDVNTLESRLTEDKSELSKDQRWYIDPVGNTMLIFEPGAFLMGSDVQDVENPAPRHLRRIERRFAIAMLETTVGQYSRLMGEVSANSVNNARDENPANAVSWFQAAEYCNRLSALAGLPESEWYYAIDNQTGELREVGRALHKSGYRLPTEAEWEYACRAGTTTPRFFGYSDQLLPEYAWCLLNSPDAMQHPVGLKKPNDFGLFDVYGNTIEWTNDWFQPYPGDHASVGEVPRVKVLRGSAVGDPTGFLSALRDMAPPELAGGLANGFRVSRTIAPTADAP